MRIAAALLVALLPLVAAAQERKNDDPNKTNVDVRGCVKGSVLTETSLSLSGGTVDEHPARRWRLRGPKKLMTEIKALKGQELQIVGATKNHPSGMAIGGARIGTANIGIGNPNPSARDPLPEQPTIDVESFTTTGESCR
jgi:hypothetical protein